MRCYGLMSVVLLVLWCAGCNKHLDAPDAISMGDGRVESVFRKSVPEMTNAARALLVGQKLMLVQYASDPASGKVVAYTRESQRIEIDVRPEEKGSRVIITTDGASGDQFSMNLLNGLRQGR